MLLSSLVLTDVTPNAPGGARFSVGSGDAPLWQFKLGKLGKRATWKRKRGDIW